MADAERGGSSAKKAKVSADAAEPVLRFSDTGRVGEMLPLFYQKLFPASEMVRWLSYGNESGASNVDASFFQRREFCFTLENDVFVRYQSFKDSAELRAALVKRCPAKIDIGPVFNVDPQKRAAYSSLGSDRVFAPTERELVFDVDLTDYDDIRSCCSGGAICTKCWPFMTIAIAVVNASLRDDFGFQHLLWVYSGRRGVHCWVCDTKARRLTNEQRTSVAEFFAVSKGGEPGARKVRQTFPLHPSLQRAHDTVLREMWISTILPEQRLLEIPERIDDILGFIPDEGVRESLATRFKSGKRVGQGSEEEASARWAVLVREVERAAKQRSGLDAQLLNGSLMDMVFAHTFPRLDVEVSKHMNHLLKAPFCVHPKTGRVCVPIDPSIPHLFDPMTVPTVARLLNELTAPGTAGGDAAMRHEDSDLEKTSLFQHVGVFRSAFLEPLLRESVRELHEAIAPSAAPPPPSLAW